MQSARSPSLPNHPNSHGTGSAHQPQRTPSRPATPVNAPPPPQMSRAIVAGMTAMERLIEAEKAKALQAHIRREHELRDLLTQRTADLMKAQEEITEARLTANKSAEALQYLRNMLLAAGITDSGNGIKVDETWQNLFTQVLNHQTEVRGSKTLPPSATTSNSSITEEPSPTWVDPEYITPDGNHIKTEHPNFLHALMTARKFLNASNEVAAYWRNRALELEKQVATQTGNDVLDSPVHAETQPAASETDLNPPLSTEQALNDEEFNNFYQHPDDINYPDSGFFSTSSSGDLSLDLTGIDASFFNGNDDMDLIQPSTSSPPVFDDMRPQDDVDMLFNSTITAENFQDLGSPVLHSDMSPAPSSPVVSSTLVDEPRDQSETCEEPNAYDDDLAMSTTLPSPDSSSSLTSLSSADNDEEFDIKLISDSENDSDDLDTDLTIRRFDYNLVTNRVAILKPMHEIETHYVCILHCGKGDAENVCEFVLDYVSVDNMTTD
ncbi:hypothetical protein C8Q75DRAFT_804901 [Abortiporus biennis]|nr:hypothetical protein C8Q75DRAFT_804901 [Abortiporus biennis]